jgi:hypothetical protein
MSGKKGRSGRLPRAIELQRSRGKDDALSCVRRRLPEILEVIVQKAEAGDKECAIYCVDRVLGRPRLEVDQRMKSEISFPDPSKLLEAHREALEAVRAIEAEWLERGLESPMSNQTKHPDSGSNDGGTGQTPELLPPDKKHGDTE